MKHLLVIDDDQRLRDLLKRYLSQRGFHASAAADAAAAERLMSVFDFDALIVDVMMPGEDGIGFVRRLRPNNQVPVILLTAKSQVEDRLAGFEAGIDDFLAKPFEPRELVWRIESLLRRSSPESARNGLVRFGDYYFDFDQQKLMKDKNKIELTRNEREILALFLSRQNEVISREDLLLALDEGGHLRNVDVVIARLRKKVETDPKNPQFIHTVRGEGYHFIGSRL